MFLRELSEQSPDYLCNERQGVCQASVSTFVIIITSRKAMASYSVDTHFRQKSLIWGPYSVVCKKLKKDAAYCKLWLQIQYVSFTSTFSVPKNLGADDKVKYISLRLLNSTIPVCVGVF